VTLLRPPFFEIGSALCHSLLEEEGLEDVLFDVVDLINEGSVKRIPDFAELKLKAAEKARSMSAFYSPAKYVSSGISLTWMDHRGR
jgi:hypothetical protein